MTTRAPTETLFADLINGEAHLDSLYFAYSVYDSASVYLPECPDPVTVFNLWSARAPSGTLNKSRWEMDVWL